MTHEQKHPGQHAQHATSLYRAGGQRLAAALLCSGLCAVAPVLAEPGEGPRHDSKTAFSETLSETYSKAGLSENSTERSAKPDPAMDPFLAGALGIIPFASGLYVSDRPARGILFTAVDVLAVLGVYTSRYTIAGDPNNARNYFILMAANNLVDALVSVRYANTRRHTALILPTSDGGLQASLHLRF